MGRVDRIRDALTALGASVYHFTAPPNAQPPYIVYAGDGANDFLAGDHHAETADQGTTDLYTLDDADPLIDAIPQALETSAMAWYRNSIQYEEDTRLIHYEWVWEV